MDCSPPGSSVQGILQARTLEWVVIFPTQGPNPMSPVSPALAAGSLPPNHLTVLWTDTNSLIMVPKRCLAR